MKKFIVATLIGTIMLVSSGYCAKCEEKINVSESIILRTTNSIVEEINGEIKTFTLEELKKYNGQNGNPSYVAVDGKVYDVTNAKGWKNGKHRCGITAGKDLTKEIEASPHGKEALKNLPQVGIIK